MEIALIVWNIIYIFAIIPLIFWDGMIWQRYVDRYGGWKNALKAQPAYAILVTIAMILIVIVLIGWVL